MDRQSRANNILLFNFVENKDSAYIVDNIAFEKNI